MITGPQQKILISASNHKRGLVSMHCVRDKTRDAMLAAGYIEMLPRRDGDYGPIYVITDKGRKAVQ